MADAAEAEQQTKAASGTNSGDPRFAHLIKQICGLLKAKPEAAAKIQDDEKSAKACTSFFDDSEERSIFLFPASKDVYSASRTPPSNFKQKCLYMYKREDTVTKENVESCVCTAEFGTTPLEQILAVSQVFFQPSVHLNL